MRGQPYLPPAHKLRAMPLAFGEVAEIDSRRLGRRLVTHAIAFAFGIAGTLCLVIAIGAGLS
jgi:hypothetical protein